MTAPAFTSPARGSVGPADSSLDDLLAEVQRRADRPLAEAITLPPEVYTSPAFFDWETREVHRREWLGLAHISQLPQPGDFLNLEVLGEPLIVVHGKDGVYRTLSRVCPHRAMDIMPPGFGYDGHGPAERRDEGESCGHTRLFLCPYHHWSFELDGKLKACPEMHLAHDFQREEHSLETFRTEVWQGFIFVNLDGRAQPVAEQYAPLGQDIAGWDTGSMQLVIERAWECPFNWKVLVENFMEPYHHLGAHAKTLQPLMPAKNTWCAGERAHSIRLNLPLKESALAELRAADAEETSRGFPLIAELPGEHQEQWSAFLGFPSFLLFSGPDRMIWYRIDPLTPQRSRLLTTVLVRPEVPQLPDYAERHAAQVQMLIDFHLEDMEVCTAVQRGLNGQRHRPGRLSHLEMPIWLLQRYLAARARGTWPTLDRPAAPAQR